MELATEVENRNIRQGKAIPHLAPDAFEDYKAYLQHRIDSAAPEKGYKTRLAEAAGCHPSLLSQVLNGHVHLTPDHAARLVNFWRLDSLDGEYFMTLVYLERAASPEYIRLLKGKLHELRKCKIDLANRLKQPRISEEKLERRYYSSWIWAAAHVLCSVSGLQTTEELAKRLMISVSDTRKILGELESMGLVCNEKERWSVSNRSLHLPRSSPFYQQHLTNWRHKALMHSLTSEDGVHYSAIQGLSHKDVERLRELILQFIEETRRIIGPSTEEEVVCLNIDYFPI